MSYCCDIPEGKDRSGVNREYEACPVNPVPDSDVVDLNPAWKTSKAVTKTEKAREHDKLGKTGSTNVGIAKLH